MSQLGYAPDGGVESLQLGNELWEHITYNKRRQTTEIGVGASRMDSSVLRLACDYGAGNNNGNVRSQTMTVPGLASPLTQMYSYDMVNRLLVATETGGTNPWQQYFAYDRFGNRRCEGKHRPSTAFDSVSPIRSRGK